MRTWYDALADVVVCIVYWRQFNELKAIGENCTLKQFIQLNEGYQSVVDSDCHLLFMAPIDYDENILIYALPIITRVVATLR